MDEIKTTLSYFDRAIGRFKGIPDVIESRATTLRDIGPLGVGTHTFIVQTVRSRDDKGKSGDFIFLQDIAGNEAVQVVIPPKVAETIARQRDQLTAKSRSKASRQVMEGRMARGEQPGFLKAK